MVKAKGDRPSRIGPKGSPKGQKINFAIDSDDSEHDDYLDMEDGEGDDDTHIVNLKVSHLYKDKEEEPQHGHHGHHHKKPVKKAPSCCYTSNSCSRGGCSKPSSPKGCSRGCQPGMSWKSCRQGSPTSPCGPSPCGPVQQQEQVVIRQPASVIAHSHYEPASVIAHCEVNMLEQSLAQVEAERAAEVEGIARHIIHIQQEMTEQPDLNATRIPALPKIDFTDIEQALTELDHTSRDRAKNKADIMALMQILDQQDNDNLEKIRELEGMELAFDGSSIEHQVDMLVKSENDLKANITNINIHLGDLDGIEKKIAANSAGIKDFNSSMTLHLEERERFRAEVLRNTEHVTRQIARGKEDNERLTLEMLRLEEALGKLDKDYQESVQRVGDIHHVYGENMDKLSLLLDKFQIRMGALEHGVGKAKKDSNKLADTLKDIRRNILSTEDELRKLGG